MPNLYLHLTPPRIPEQALPEIEQEAASSVQSSLRDLSSYVQEFEGALALFDYAYTLLASDLQQAMTMGASNWHFVAARDGAMSLYHYSKAFEGLKDTLHKAPTLKAAVDNAQIKAATKRFNRVFPWVLKMRHSIAHSAELTDRPENLKKNAVTGPFQDEMANVAGEAHIVYRNVLYNRTFKNTIDGAVISYDVNAATLVELIEITQEFFNSFKGVGTLTAPTS